MTMDGVYFLVLTAQRVVGKYKRCDNAIRRAAAEHREASQRLVRIVRYDDGPTPTVIHEFRAGNGAWVAYPYDPAVW